MELIPTNILVKIFEQLNDRELIAISCTCHKFLDVTTNFIAIKFPPVRVDFKYLHYNKLQKFTYAKDAKDFNVVIDTKRLFQNYILINFNKEHTDRLGNKWLLLFKKQINARTIRIKSDCMDLLQLYELLKLTNRLVYLEIDGYRLSKLNDQNFTSATLPLLKHLKIHSFLDTTPQLFKIFEECKSLKSIILSALCVESENIQPVNEFLFNQKSLEHLDLIGLETQKSLFKCDHVQEVQYKLNKLNVEYNGYSICLENFVNFFVHQKSLREVKLALDLRNSMQQSSDTNQCDEIIRHCLALENLRSLSVLVNKYSLKNLELPINRCIKKLTFENETRDNNFLLVSMLKSLRNLKVLELACDYDEEILAQLPLMTKLRSLKLADYHQGLLKNIKCTENLESISVKYCYTRNSGPDWVEFLQHHPKIKKIQIDHSIDFLDDAICEIIAGACGDNLIHFELTDSVAKNLSENSYKSFQRHCINLKFLKLLDKPSKHNQNKHQSFHDILANVKCVIFFYVICIVFFIVLIFLMFYGKI